MLATYMQCMRNNNLVIRIAGSSCSRNKQDYLDQPDRAPTWGNQEDLHNF